MIVVDASVLANVVGDDHLDGDAARRRIASEADIAAPDLADVETVAVLRKRWLAGDLDDRRFGDAVASPGRAATATVPCVADARPRL